MRWEKEYEHRRDMGHTWGPGVDDRYEYTEEELAQQQKEQEAFALKLASYRVAPRSVYLQAGKELKESLPSRKDRIYGTVPYDWRRKYNDAQLILCKKAAESLGYAFTPFDQAVKDESLFSVAIDYYGWLPERSGNIHRYAASGIQTIEDCLQLVADFASIGKTVTTYFSKSFHYCCNDTGELRYELEHWCERNGLPLPSLKQDNTRRSLTEQLSGAAVSASPASANQKKKPRETDQTLER